MEYMETNSDDDGLDDFVSTAESILSSRKRKKYAAARKTSASKSTKVGGGRDSSRAREEEKKLAASAAKESTSVMFGPGEKAKTPRDTDHQDKVDDYFDGMKNEEKTMASVMEKIAAAIPAPAVSSAPTSSSVRTSTLESVSPNTKYYKSYKSVSNTIRELVKERKEFVEAGLPTDDVDAQLQALQARRSALNEAKGSGTNLGSAFSGC